MKSWVLPGPVVGKAWRRQATRWLLKIPPGHFALKLLLPHSLHVLARARCYLRCFPHPENNGFIGLIPSLRRRGPTTIRRHVLLM